MNKYTLALLLVFAIQLHSQTRLDSEQVVGGTGGAINFDIGPGLHTVTVNGKTTLRLDPSYIDALVQLKQADARCRGPVLTTVNQKELLIGEYWSTEHPCYLHFMVEPPYRPDPLSVVRWNKSFRLFLHPDFTGNTTIYVYALPPTATTPARLAVDTDVSGVFDFDLSPCHLEGRCVVTVAPPGDGTTARTFPTGAMPLGVVEVFEGQLHPQPYSIANYHQIQSTSPMTVRTWEGNYLFQIADMTQAQELTDRLLEQARRIQHNGQAQILRRQILVDNEPPTARQVIALMKKIDEMEERLYLAEEALGDRPQKLMREDLAMQVETLSMEAHALNETAQMVNEAYNRVMWDNAYQGSIDYVRADPPEDLKAKCKPGSWAVTDYMRYFCMADEHWGVVTVMRPVTPAKITVDTQ
jgi:hypothetical protein